MAYLEINNLKKSYGRNQILHGINLQIEQGEFISLLGASGSGKTTILRCIAGLERPDEDSGQLKLDHKVLSGAGSFVLPEARRLGMVFQNYAVWPHMTVRENIAFPLEIAAKRGEIEISDIAIKVSEVLSLVKLSTLATRYAHELSGGQQQRVALARALVMSPKVLLLDEPLSNLDALLREELGSEIRRLQKAMKLTTVLVTHDQKEALSLSDRIILLEKGRIDAQGAPEALYSQPPTRFCETFLAGAQSLTDSSGASRPFIPRRWSENSTGESCQILSRLYLGNEYEYLVQARKFTEPFRYYSSKKHEAGDSVMLSYRE